MGPRLDFMESKLVPAGGAPSGSETPGVDPIPVADEAPAAAGNREGARP